MRRLRNVRVRKEWRSTSTMPPAKDHLAWVTNAWVQHMVFGALVLALGFFAQNSSVGMVLTGLYAVAALALRLPSDLTFKITLIGLVALPVLTFTGKQELVGVYAQYVFLLLCVGTVGALIEQWRQGDSFFEVGLPVHAKVGASGRPAI
ncbi:MAG TPA: hypothetical protein VLA88_05430 [Candidatus Saccharimonadales bacterium]|nr:hypothetical protein [Candidatus Saccharimonadales bacterium]